VPHSSLHLAAAAAVLAGPAALIAGVRNRVIRRRLLFSALAGAAAAVVHLLAAAQPDTGFWAAHGWRIEQLVLLVATANAVVALVFNPWFRDGESDRAPAIVQDSFVAAIGIVAAAQLFDVSSFSFLTGSAILAAIVGFALQDTLGNAFAGIAIQIERPFRVGHWIGVGEWVGLVTEVTWRSTKIRTKAGTVVALPNSVLGGQAITNYSEPTAPVRIHVEVGAAYGAPPNDVRDALLTAMRRATSVRESPAPDVILTEFGGSAIVYRARFWVDDFSKDEFARDEVRSRIYYEFKRREIEIPWPIQVQYEHREVAADPAARRDRSVSAIARVPVLARLPEDAHRALASAARELLFADGEMIVREGERGGSMFVVITGRVEVVVGPERRVVATTEAGGYFGEMSLLTGESRTATVVARGDSTVLEITGDAFRAYVQTRPEVIDELANAASQRRAELDTARAAAGTAAGAATASLRARMREFFGLA
jgi:small-conductance mechanosensitive channel/CRP-like cAMP-binding protein